MQSLNVIGAGKLGQTLARLWARAGEFEIGAVLCRSQRNAEQAVEFIGAGTATRTGQPVPPAQVWMISTPESQIVEIAGALHASQVLRPGNILFHCSGALDSLILDGGVADHQLLLASAHPLHSFARPHLSIDQFAGSWCTLEGHPDALARLQLAFERIGAQTVAIDAQGKGLYHAGSVVACNYLVALLDSALQIMEAAGLPRRQAAKLLRPIVHATADNALATPLDAGPDATGNTDEDPLLAALTGPIARGESELVARQLARLSALNPPLGEIYRVLGLQALSIAQRGGRLEASAQAALAQALAKPEAER